LKTSPAGGRQAERVDKVKLGGEGPISQRGRGGDKKSSPEKRLGSDVVQVLFNAEPRR